MGSFTQASVRNPSALPWISLVTVWFVWGSTYLGIRVAVQTIPPLLMAGSRYFIAGAILASILWLARRGRVARPSAREMKSALLSGVLLLLIGNGTLCYAETRLESSTASLIAASVPIWMLLIDACFTRRIHPLAIAGIVVGAFGMIVLVGGPSAHVPLGPAAMVMIGVIAWALGSVLARHHQSEALDPLFPAYEMIAGGALLSLAGLVTGELPALHLDRISQASFEGYVWLIVMGAIVGYTAYGYAVRTLPTSVVATYAYVNPIVAVTLGALLLHEPLTFNLLAGGSAIVVAVAIILFSNRQTAAQAQAPYDYERAS